MSRPDWYDWPVKGVTPWPVPGKEPGLHRREIDRAWGRGFLWTDSGLRLLTDTAKLRALTRKIAA